MADLGFLQDVSTVGLIDRAYEKARKPRGYLGLSQAGMECKRALWYTAKGYEGEPCEGRVLRLFQMGNLVETQIIADLSMVDCLVYHQQREVVFTQDGVQLVGHIDGIVIGLKESSVPHLLEIKSCNEKKFQELKKAGDYERWNPQYGFQVQAYCLGLNLRRAAAFVYNKNTSEMIMFRIRSRRTETVEKLQRIFEVITSIDVPDRLCPREDFYKAKFCPYREECFNPKQQVVQVGW